MRRWPAKFNLATGLTHSLAPWRSCWASEIFIQMSSDSTSQQIQQNQKLFFKWSQIHLFLCWTQLNFPLDSDLNWTNAAEKWLFFWFYKSVASNNLPFPPNLSLYLTILHSLWRNQAVMVNCSVCFGTLNAKVLALRYFISAEPQKMWHTLVQVFFKAGS